MRPSFVTHRCISLIPFLVITSLILSAEIAKAQSPFKVGAFIPFSGRWGESGRECAKGLLDAGKWINQEGGLFGRRLEILVAEDTGRPAETLAVFRKWNEADQVHLFFIYSTETALSLSPHIHYHRIPTLVSALPSHVADPVKYPFLFTTAPTVLDIAKIGILYVSEKSGIKTRKPKMLFAGTSSPFDQHFLPDARGYAKEVGVDVGLDLLIDPPFSPSALSAIAGQAPDFVYLSLSARESLGVLQEAMKMGLKTRWIGNRRAFDETLSSFDGVLGVQPVAPYGEGVPGMTPVREAHQRWHPYDFHSLSYVEGWGATQVIAEVFGRSLPEHRFSRERIRSSFETLKDYVLGGLLPPITITPTDHRPSVESRILSVREGKISPQTGFLSLKR